MRKILIGLSLIVLVTTGGVSSQCPAGWCSLAEEDSDQCYIPVDGSCDADLHCGGNGQCFWSAMTNAIFCNCTEFQFGDKCQFSVNSNSSVLESCTTIDCKNGGYCAQGENVCRCPAGFRGVYCEIETRTMVEDGQRASTGSNLCQNGGRPYIQGMKHACQCPCGYTGDLCEIVHANAELYPDACRAKICHGHGNCVGDSTSTYCICDRDYSGVFCDLHNHVTATESDKCKNYVCEHGGTCQTLDTDRTEARCICPHNFYGYHCELTRSSDPSRQSNTCEHYNLTCHNGGTCYINDNVGAYCVCPRGFSGPFCATSHQCGPYRGCKNTLCPTGTVCVEVGICLEPSCHKSKPTTTSEPAGDTKKPNRTVYYVIIGMIPYVLFVICSIALHKRRRERSHNLEAPTETHQVDVPDTQRLTRHPSLEVFRIVDFIDTPSDNQNVNMPTTHDLVRVIASQPETLCITRLPRYESSTSIGCPPKYSQIGPDSGYQSQLLSAVGEYTPHENTVVAAAATSRGSLSSLGMPPPYTQEATFTLSSSDTSINSNTALLPPPSRHVTSGQSGRDHFRRPRMCRSVSANSYGQPPPYTSTDNMSVHSVTLISSDRTAS